MWEISVYFTYENDHLSIHNTKVDSKKIRYRQVSLYMYVCTYERYISVMCNLKTYYNKMKNIKYHTVGTIPK